MKKIGIALVFVAIAAAGALLWLGGNIDRLLRDAIVEYGSVMTRASVRVDGVKISASGEGTITGLEIGNPEGFKTAHAMKLKEFTVAIDPATLAGDVVTIKKIAIVAPQVIYEKGDQMTNFDAIQRNIADYLGPSRQEDSGPGKKLIVEELSIKGAKAEVSAPFMDGDTVSVDLPDIVLHNIGKAQGGVTPGELGQAIAGAMKKQLTQSISFDKLGKAAAKAASDAAKAAGDAATGVADKVKSLF